MNGRNPSGNGQQAGSSNPASTSSTSSSSLMAKFYQPMNAPFVPPTPTPPPPPPPPPPLPPQQQQQYQQQVPIPITISVGDHQGYAPMQTRGIGANAAQLLANLATTPGYISDEAILEYSRRHQHQHTSQWQQPFSQSEPPSNQPQPYLAPTQYQQFQTQGYSQDFNRVQPSIQQSHDSRVSNDPNAAIGALLNELQQTGATASIATSTPSYPLYASIPPPQSQPQPLVPPPDIPSQSQSIQSGSEHRSPCASSSIQQPSQEQSGDDFSSGKITPHLLKKLAALAESDVQSGSTLLNEIKRLRSRQTKTERSLYEDREELLNKQKRDFVKLQASEIMGVNVENEMQRTKSLHREELKRFDQRVVRAMDKEIMLVQESLAQADVPLMFSTQDPGKIASQIRVLRLLEDMLQT